MIKTETLISSHYYCKNMIIMRYTRDGKEQLEVSDLQGLIESSAKKYGLKRNFFEKPIPYHERIDEAMPSIRRRGGKIKEVPYIVSLGEIYKSEDMLFKEISF